MRPLLLIALIPLSLGPACAAPAPTPAAAASSPAPSAVFPAPYTAEQLRAASRVGRAYVFRAEIEGKPTALRELRFTKVEAERAEVTATVRDESGKVIETRPPQSATWDDLRKHGEFPRERVTTADEEIRVPAGTYQVTVYTVRGDGGEVERFYFAKNMPGPPVLFVTEKDGKRVKATTLVEYRSGE